MTFEKIAALSQPVLKTALLSELARIEYEPQNCKGFIYAQGKVPVLLVAHLDTIHKERVRTICYSHDRNIIMSPQGIGGDDRAGIYMIMNIIKKHRCHVLFCEDEEIGGIGATAFAKSCIKPQVNYIIELDRKGSNDAVFYDCDNPEFTKFVTSFGFEEDYGSFSDISIIAPELQIAAVNLSAGFYNEHTLHEHVNMKDIRNSIKRVCKMVSSKTEKFEYIENDYMDDFRWWGQGYAKKHNIPLFKSKGGESSIISLMPLDESFYIKNTKGEYEEILDEEYFINSSGTVFQYLYDLDVAYKLPEYSALSENGTPARYDEESAIGIEVAAEDYLDALCRRAYGENRNNLSTNLFCNERSSKCL